jgi:hypothetical protein
MPAIEFNLPEKKPMEMIQVEPGVYVATEPMRKRENHDFFTTSLVYPSGVAPAAAAAAMEPDGAR